jgi:hypothetical protein
MIKQNFTKTTKTQSGKIFIGLATLVISISQYSCNHSLYPLKGEVSILNKETEENLASHKEHDVEVFRTIFMGQAYGVRYYQKENDTLRSHSATYGDVDIYDKAKYSWLNDTTVLVRLYNTVSKKEKAFKVYGYG